MFQTVLAAIHEGEEGHVAPLIGSLGAGVGAILLAIGATRGSDGMTIAGGVVLALGILVYGVIHHGTIDKELYGRVDRLDRK